VPWRKACEAWQGVSPGCWRVGKSGKCLQRVGIQKIQKNDRLTREAVTRPQRKNLHQQAGFFARVRV
jgi:hypothetical protein